MTFPLHLLIVCQNGWKPKTIGVNCIYIPEWEGLHFPGLAEEAVKLIVIILVPLPSQASTRVKLERWGECGNERHFKRQSCPQAASLRSPCFSSTRHMYTQGKRHRMLSSQIMWKWLSWDHSEHWLWVPWSWGHSGVASALCLRSWKDESLKQPQAESRGLWWKETVFSKAALRTLFLLGNQLESVGCWSVGCWLHNKIWTERCWKWAA